MNEQLKKRKKIVIILLLQILNIIYSLDSVLIKLASIAWNDRGLFSIQTLVYLSLAVGVLGIYAIFWQYILSKVKLSMAYFNRGVVVFWGMLWAALFFSETINLANIIGCVFIFLGVILVNKNE